jgi:hypothetical protein
MRWWTRIVLVLGGLGCATVDSPSTPGPETEKPVVERGPNEGPGMEHAEQALAACVEACEQENAMRSVAAEIIRADCERSCGSPAPALGTPSLP